MTKILLVGGPQDGHELEFCNAPNRYLIYPNPETALKITKTRTSRDVGWSVTYEDVLGDKYELTQVYLFVDEGADG